MLDVTSLDDYFRDLERQDRFSGAVWIGRGDEPLFTGAYGIASRAWKIPNTLDTRFDTASITKLFTAVATLQMIDQGRLAFDTRAIDFLELTGTSIAREVTVFQLLTHTSGIGDDADEEAGDSYEAVWRTRPNYSVTETADFLPQFAHKPPNFPPGQGCRYCNCGYVLLGLMIEKATGMKYRDYVREHVFVQAGMADSDFLRMDRVHEGVAEGCDPIRDDRGAITGWKRNVYSFPPIGSPDGGAHVTAVDLARFFEALRAGQLLSPGRTKAFFTPQVVHRRIDGGVRKYGHGLWFFVDLDGQVVFGQKEGVNPGVSGLIRHYPRQDHLTVVLLSNLQDGVWRPVKEIHEMIAGGRFD